MSHSADLRLQRTFYVNSTWKFTLAVYEKLLKFQGGCGICGAKPKSTRLAVDHRHSDGLLRGLLCLRCNRAWGLFHDNDCNRLMKAAEYLRNPPFVTLFGYKHTAPGRLNTKVRARLLAKMRANG